MAPEQVRGAAADHRADIFAFGAIADNGRRFLVATEISTPRTPETPLTVIVNWPATLKK